MKPEYEHVFSLICQVEYLISSLEILKNVVKQVQGFGTQTLHQVWNI